MDHYLALTRHARGYTLMDPLGGAPARYEDRTESVKASASYFKAGEAQLELVQAHAWGDTVVLVMIERQHGQVGGLPDQDWSLRVTRSLAATAQAGRWCIATPTRSSMASTWSGRPRSPAADPLPVDPVPCAQMRAEA